MKHDLFSLNQTLCGLYDGIILWGLVNALMGLLQFGRNEFAILKIQQIAGKMMA
jgi:hypothetical protein